MHMGRFVKLVAIIHEFVVLNCSSNASYIVQFEECMNSSSNHVPPLERDPYHKLCINQRQLHLCAANSL